LVENVGSKLLSFVLFTVLARLVTPSDFGIVQMAQTVSGIAWLLAEQGVSAYLVQKTELSAEVLNTVFWFSVWLACTVAGLAVFAAPLVGEAYAASDVQPVLQAIVVLIPIGALSWVHSALLTRELQFRSIASRRLIAVSAGGVGGVVLALQGYGVWSLIGKLAIETGLTTALTWWMCPWRPGLKLSPAEISPMLRAGMKLTAGHLVGHISLRVDDVLIGLYLGPTALGYYAVAVRAIVLAQEVAVSTAQRAAMPIFAKLQRDIPRLAAAYRGALGPAAAMTIPIFFGISASAFEISATLFGPEWSAAVPAMRVLGLGGLAFGGALFFPPLALGTGRTQLFAVTQFIIAPINLVALWIGVQFGLIGVAAASLVRAYIWLAASVWTANRVLSIPVASQAKLLAPAAVSAMFMVVCVLGARLVLPPMPAALSLLTVVSIGAAAYIFSLCVLSRETVRDLVQLAANVVPQRST
jgi:O-antigen/teichoic acid export membrane protein